MLCWAVVVLVSYGQPAIHVCPGVKGVMWTLACSPLLSMTQPIQSNYAGLEVMSVSFAPTSVHIEAEMPTTSIILRDPLTMKRSSSQDPHLARPVRSKSFNRIGTHFAFSNGKRGYHLSTTSHNPAVGQDRPWARLCQRQRAVLRMYPLGAEWGMISRAQLGCG